ncbi:MAG: hypothetical protein H6703_06730 [Myxococcales bacterium]|nr:hypothetical protein [Myxococcales bacterium]
MRSLLPLLLVALVGCDDILPQPQRERDGGPDSPECHGAGSGSGDRCPSPPDPDACRPPEEAWQGGVGQHFLAWCGACHGETPRYGAPFPLNHPLFFTENPATTPARVADLIRRGAMPPPGQPQPDATAREAMLRWLTCGADDAPPPGANPGGFDVDRPILQAPADPPAGTDFFDLRADDFEMGPGILDLYQCFTFTAPIDRPRTIRRIEARIDDARVVHHIVLLPGDGTGTDDVHGDCGEENPLSLIYGWAPGQGALHFDDGGLHLAPGQRLTLQIHYNNSARHEDVRDASGVRIYHAPVEPGAPVIDMLTFGPTWFTIPARGAAEITGYCQIPQDTTLIASFPHMHGLGVGFEQTVRRADGTEEGIIRIDGYDFDSQYIYDTPVELRAGDTVITRCRYRNPRETLAHAGTRSEDEMCFNFGYITPPLPARYCNRNTLRPPAVYTPGACAPRTARPVEHVGGRFVIGAPPLLIGGPVPRGRYRLDRHTVVLPSIDLGIGYIDPEQSQTSAAGQIWIDGDRLVVDLLVNVHLTHGYGAIEEDVPVSVEGIIRALDPLTGAIALDLVCGAHGAAELAYETTPDGRLRLAIEPTGLGLPVTFVLELSPAGP